MKKGKGITPYDKDYFDAYVEKFAAKVETEWANGVHYTLVTRKDDGFVGIFEYANGRKYPLTEACNISKAKEYIGLREPVTVPLTAIC